MLYNLPLASILLKETPSHPNHRMQATKPAIKKGYCGFVRWDIFDFLLQRPTGSHPLRPIQNFSNGSVIVEQDNLANCQKRSENRRGRRPFLKTARKKVPLLTSPNPLNLVKHKACRTTHAKCSQEEQVQ